jgi:ATP-binding cassette subfamily F protein uup
MALLSIRQLSISFGGPSLLENISVQVEKGERICLLGRNGAGKSTLLKLIAGELTPDSGNIDRQQGLQVARLDQEVPRDLTGSVYDVIAAGFGLPGELLCRYRSLSLALAAGDEGQMHEMMEIQQAIDSASAWPLDQKIEQIISRLDLDADAQVESLSGGVMRRVLLARALAIEPDILLLDEPTNHLDIASIDWLETFLKRENMTLIFITHDRSFLRSLATRIIEIDRGRLFDFACNYDTFLRHKQELLHNEEQEWKKFDKKLAEEEVWIRKGIKARRTRNEGRVRALKQMRDERSQRRDRIGKARLQLKDASKSGKLVVEAEGLTFAYGDNVIINDFSTTVLRGDRIGIIGPNGVGKTTLIKLLLGQLQPESGSIRLGTNLEILYFDQLREQLDPDKTVQQNLSGDQDTVTVAGQSRHVYGYLQDFLFTPDRARTPVRILSGGERNRLLLARLFTKEANVLILDEPTNDLDLETLDLLEEMLSEYKGTLFLVSHDRDFLNRVVTSTIAFEGDGKIAEYIGGYDDWLRQRPTLPDTKLMTAPKMQQEKPAPNKPRKLSYKQKQTLEKLPAQIEALETEQASLHTKISDPSFYKEPPEQIGSCNKRLEEIEKELKQGYAIWEELEAIKEDQ